MTDAIKAMAEFWSTQGRAMLEAQQQATQMMSEGMQAMLSGKLPPGATPEAALAQTSEAMTQLWSAAAKMSSELAGNLKRQAAGSDDGVTSALFERITDPRQWLASTGGVTDVLSRLADGPRLADLWDLERRSARMLKAWTDLRRHAFDQQQVVLDVWLQAGRQYLVEMAERARADGRSLDSKAAFRLWTDIANRHLVQMQRSEAFLAAQREMIRASTELRLAQTDLGEHFAKHYGLPSRTELDDVHRTVTELRREMRRLRRTLAEAPPAAAAPAAAPPSLERRAGRRKTAR